MRITFIIAAFVIVLLTGLALGLVLYFDEDRLKTLLVDQVRQQTGRELTLSGPLGLKVFPRIAIDARDVSLSGPPTFDGPELFAADQLSLSVALRPLLGRRIEADSVLLHGAVIHLHTDAAGRHSLDGLADRQRESGMEAEAVDLAIDEILLRDVDFRLSDAGPVPPQQISLRQLRIQQLAPGKAAPFDLALAAGPDGALDISATGRLTWPEPGAEVSVDDLDLAARMGDHRLVLTGRLTLDPGPPLTLDLAPARLSHEGEKFDLAAGLVLAERPRFTVSMQGGRLDLDRLIVEAESADGSEQTADSPLHMLADLDADLELELDQLVLSGLTITGVETRLVSDAGRLRLDPLRGNLPGARVQASAEVDLNQDPARVRLSPRLDLDSLAEALAPWRLDRFLDGGGELGLSLSGQGLSAQTLLASLDGSGQYALRDGVLNGIDLGSLIEHLAARDAGGAISAAAGGQTRFDEFIGDLEVSQGRMQLPQLTLQGPGFALGGTLQIDLASLGIDGDLRLNSERLPTAVPIRLAGSLDSVRIEPDLARVVEQEVTRRALRELGRRLDRSPDEREEEAPEPDHDPDPDP